MILRIFVEGLPSLAVDWTLLFYVLSVGAIEVIGVLMAGWASNNKFALIGAFRQVAVMISYEIPMVVALLTSLLLAVTLTPAVVICVDDPFEPNDTAAAARLETSKAFAKDFMQRHGIPTAAYATFDDAAAAADVIEMAKVLL